MKLLFIFLFIFHVYGAELKHTHAEQKKHIHGIHRECPIPSSSIDIINCALDFHPNIQEAKYEIDSSHSLTDKALQIPNPKLSSRYVKGQQDDFETSELELNLQFQIELGGKKQARVEQANSILESSKAILDERKVEVKIQTTLALYRLKQVFEEEKLLANLIESYTKVIKKLKGIPRLNSEQEASLILFEIALEETKIEKGELYQEEKKIAHYFHIATGNSLDEIKPYVPIIPTEWPQISTQKHRFKSARIKRLIAQSAIAAREVEIEKSNSWSNLAIGPSIAVERGQGRVNEMVGFNLSLPLPLFHSNDGAQSVAKSRHLKSQKIAELNHAYESHERFEQLQVYESTVEILRTSLSSTEIMKKHQRLDRLYSRGVVSNQVYLDSLKQKLKYIQSINQRVMTAIESLWSIYKFDGKVMEKELK